MYVLVKNKDGCILLIGGKMKVKRLVLFGVVFIVLILSIILFITLKPNKMINLKDKTLEEIKEYANSYKLNLTINEQYNYLEKGKIINQSIEEGTIIKKDDQLIITFSKGLDYNDLKVHELGKIPIMMYHGIEDTTDNKYTGGNVDKAGYHRTKQAFMNDLEFYYKSGYRMIRLKDYVDGIIDVAAGLSPIILTFDDGLSNAIRVTGLDNNGNIIIDSNSAIGVLESFKEKYSDYNVTATFFINGGLFKQPEYNEKILNWLINNGYDIGNHTYNHAYLDRINSNDVQKQIGSMYSKLNEIIPNKYLNIVALPYGIPYNKNHNNFKYIIEGEYNNFKYKTNGILRVGWDSNVSPHSKDFDPHSIKRARAYDNNGKDFDIKMVFNLLEKTRYVSDGNKDVVRVKDKNNIKDNINKKVVVYE